MIYNIQGKNAPTLTAWCKMIQGMVGAHDDDLPRAWLAVAFSSSMHHQPVLAFHQRASRL